MASSSSDEQRLNWAGLLSDLLGPIAGRLPIPYFARFSAVCASWRSAAVVTALLSLADGRAHLIAALPEIRGKWFVRSQDGWAITLDELSSFALLDLLSRSQIHPPPITAHSPIEPTQGPDGDLESYLCHENQIWHSPHL